MIISGGKIQIVRQVNAGTYFDAYEAGKRGKTTGTQVQHILTLNAEMAETCHRFDVMGRNYC